MPINKPISASKNAVAATMHQFEKALKSATNADGTVDMKALKVEAKAVAGDKDLAAVFEKSISVLEQSFQRSRTVGTGCGSSTVHEAPKSLSAKEVKSVFAALIEAKGKGLDKIDGKKGKKDGIISPDEARAAAGPDLSDKLASAAARGITHPADHKPAPRPTRPSSGGGNVGC